MLGAYYCAICGKQILTPPSYLEPLTDAEMKAQASRCACRGSDDYCPCQNALDKATLAARSDEQAEVVGFDTAKRAEKTILREYELGNLTALGVANHLRRAGFNLKYATDKANSLAPPAVAAGGVTEAIAAVERERRRHFCSGDDCEPYDHGRDEGFDLALKALRSLPAALEGIREGWSDDMFSAPPAMHVMACRFDHDAGEWVYAVVLSPPQYPFTHWRMLDPPPSRGEGE